MAPTPTPTAIVDELRRADQWTDQEAERVRVVADFVQSLMNDHDFETVRQRHGSDDYTQHNRNIPDGIAGLIGNLETLTKRFPQFSYDVKHVFVDGDHVIFHSHATTKHAHRGDDGKGLNIIDVWRVVDGEIAEHWDAIQPLAGSMRLYNLLTGGRVRNTNGVF